MTSSGIGMITSSSKSIYKSKSIKPNHGRENPSCLCVARRQVAPSNLSTSQHLRIKPKGNPGPIPPRSTSRSSSHRIYTVRQKQNHRGGSLNRCLSPLKLTNMQLQGGSIYIAKVGPFLIRGGRSKSAAMYAAEVCLPPCFHLS